MTYKYISIINNMSVSQHGKINIYIKQSFFEIFNNFVHFQHISWKMYRSGFMFLCRRMLYCVILLIDSWLLVLFLVLCLPWLLSFFPQLGMSLPYQKFLYSITAVLVKRSTKKWTINNINIATILKSDRVHFLWTI